jgi:hypothetical protein
MPWVSVHARPARGPPRPHLAFGLWVCAGGAVLRGDSEETRVVVVDYQVQSAILGADADALLAWLDIVIRAAASGREVQDTRL